MPRPITLLIAYPKELIRAGLRAMLAGSPVRIVGEAADTHSTLMLAKKHKPAVVLLDVAIPGGDAFELVRQLSSTLPDIKFIFITAVDNPTYMARAHAVGAANCLLKSVNQRELVAAVQVAAAGKPTTDEGLFATIAGSLSGRAKVAADSGLTPREEQVLRHVAFGLSNEEVAQSLAISVETVKEHVQNMLRKLAVKDRTQAAVWAVQSGVV